MRRRGWCGRDFLLGGAVDCRIRIRVRVVVLLCGVSGRFESWSGRKDRRGQRKDFSGGPLQGIREGIWERGVCGDLKKGGVAQTQDSWAWDCRVQGVWRRPGSALSRKSVHEP